MIDRLKSIIQDENTNENYSPSFALMLGILVSEDPFIQSMSIAYVILPGWSQSLGLGLIVYNLFKG